MFGSQRQVAAINFTDPAADKYIPILRAPADSVITIESGAVCADTTMAADGTNFYTVALLNGGTAGTCTTAISDTVGNETVAWTANTPKALTVVDGSGKLAAGEWLVAKYDETLTCAPGRVTVSIEFVAGLGAKG
jgi:hypothetical protein